MSLETWHPAATDRRILDPNEIWTRSRIWVRLASLSTDALLDGEALLRRHGLSVTAQRLAVLRAVSDRPHGTADDIEKAVRADIGAVSRQAVYDALAALTAKGLLRRIQPARSPAR
ncbi:MAG: transcriptional repressor, partial [Acidimicrobiia bacterium]|nr:transcriptional repressor [Acidimicrobiia bacterium]